MTAQRLALLTLEDRSDFVIDDDVGIAELRRRGLIIEEVPWRRTEIDWRAYDAVVIRTPWDYQKDVDAFLALLDRIEALGVPLANRAGLVRWNARKTYLRELSERGVDIVPTQWGRGVSPDELRALPAKFGVGECVIKPIVSANADDTYRIVPTIAEADAARIAGRFVNREWMAQPFVESVVRDGEDSLFYFSGVYSHAVNKKPKVGDFRVQEEHGGVITPLEPSPALRVAADKVMRALGEVPLQARVDLVRLADGTHALMELEAIEPSLYFAQHPEAPSHFADALQAWLTQVSSEARLSAGAQ